MHFTGGSFQPRGETACVKIVQVTRLAVRYAETDQMGVVHHSHFPVYFEVGRTEFFEQHLCHYAELERQGLRAPVIEVSYRLHSGARYGDVLVLQTRPEWLKGLRIEMSYRMTRNLSEGELIATGYTRHALLGPDLRPARKERLGGLYQKVQEVFGDGSPG
jgi:acyl-CoA thioester hydrolase